MRGTTLLAAALAVATLMPCAVNAAPATRDPATLKVAKYADKPAVAIQRRVVLARKAKPKLNYASLRKLPAMTKLPKVGKLPTVASLPKLGTMPKVANLPKLGKLPKLDMASMPRIKTVKLSTLRATWASRLETMRKAYGY